MAIHERYFEANPGTGIHENEHPLPYRRNFLNFQDKLGNTPLHYAALTGNLDVTEQYLHIGDVDPTIQNKDGEIALALAAEHRDCALAIAKRMEELDCDVPYELELLEGWRSEGYQRAKIFVASLGKDHKDGMYEHSYE